MIFLVFITSEKIPDIFSNIESDPFHEEDPFSEKSIVQNEESNYLSVNSFANSG